MQSEAHRTGLTLATKVTLLRFLGIPVFVLLLIYYLAGLKSGLPDERLRWGAFAVFVLVAATDALDGYLARSRNEITRVGKILDPLADKGLVLSALVLLTRPSLPELSPHLPIWFTTLVISRDILLIAGALVIHHLAGEVEVQPRWSGKIATALLMAAICWVLMQGGADAFRWLILVTACFTVISTAQYFIDGARQLGRIAHR